MTFCLNRLLEDGWICPIFIIPTPARVLLFPCPWTTDEQKECNYLTATLLCVAENATGLTFMGEGWMVDAPQRDPGETDAAFDARLETVSANAETSEIRREVVTVHLSYRTGAGKKRGLMRTRQIVRGDDGKPSGLIRVAGEDDVEIGEGQQFGRVHAVLPDDPPTRAQRQAATAMLTELGIEIGLQ